MGQTSSLPSRCDVLRWPWPLVVESVATFREGRLDFGLNPAQLAALSLGRLSEQEGVEAAQILTQSRGGR